MFPETFLSFTVLVSALALLEGKPLPEQGGRQTGPAAKSGGVSIEFTARKLSEADRSPQGELKAILEATATLKTDRAIRYRSVVLPPGAYPIAVSSEEARAGGRNLYFLVGPAPEGDKDQPMPEEKKPEEKRAEPARRKKGAESRGVDEKGSPRGEAVEGQGKPSDARPASGRIKALFHLAPASRASETVQFAVRPTARGDRFSITVLAGGSQGKATLRFAD
jgi:hypothetical protein